MVLSYFILNFILASMANYLSSPYMLVLGASIHAYQRSGQHLVAFESDTIIYNAILAPLRDPMPSPWIEGSQFLNMAAGDDEEHVQKVARKSRLSAYV